MEELSLLLQDFNEAPEILQQLRRLTRASTIGDKEEVISYGQVKVFLQMAQEALAARSRSLETLKDEFQTAREETTFLEKELGGLIEERANLQQRVQQLQRESHNFLMELEILREQLESGAENLAPSPSGVGQRLAAERARSAALEAQVQELTAQLQTLGHKESAKPSPQRAENDPGSPRVAGESVLRKPSASNRSSMAEEVFTFDDTTPLKPQPPIRRRRSVFHENLTHRA